MPPDHGLWLDDHHRAQTVGPDPIEQNPESSVQPREPDAGSPVTSKNLNLVAKSGDLKLQIDAGQEAGKETVEGRNNDFAHDLDARDPGPE